VLSLSSASLLDYGTSRRVLARRPPPCTSTVLIPGTWQEEPEDRGGGIFCLGAQTRTGILPYIYSIPVFGCFLPGTSNTGMLLSFN